MIEWFSRANTQMVLKWAEDEAKDYWLSNNLVKLLIGDFFETVAAEMTGAMIVANQNGELAPYGSADLVRLDKKIMYEVKGLSSRRSRIDFSGNQIKNYCEFVQEGWRVIYYIFIYDVKSKFRISNLDKIEDLFGYLIENVAKLYIIDHNDLMELIPSDQLSLIWFDEIDYIAFRHKKVEGKFRYRRWRKVKVKTKLLEFNTYELRDGLKIDVKKITKPDSAPPPIVNDELLF